MQLEKLYITAEKREETTTLATVHIRENNENQ